MNEKTTDVKPQTDKRGRMRRSVAREVVNVMKLPGTELDDGAASAVGAVAGRLGFGGGRFEDMVHTWLRPVVDEGYGTTRSGINRAKCVVNFLGHLLSGTRRKAALEKAGLSLAQLNAFRYASPELDKVYRAAIAMMKDAMGHEVLDTAYELATVGDDVRNRDGEVVGKKKSEKMLDRLLVMAGDEFQKSKNVTGDDGSRGGVGGGINLTFNFGGGNSQSLAAGKAGGEPIDV